MAAEPVDAITNPTIPEATRSAEEREFLSVLNAKITEVLEQATRQSIGLHPICRNIPEENATSKPKRPSKKPPDSAELLAHNLAELRRVRWTCAPTSEEELLLDAETLCYQITSGRLKGSLDDSRISSPIDAVAVLRGLEIMEEKNRMPGREALQTDKIPTWEDVLDHERGFSVTSLSSNGESVWKGVFCRFGSSFSLTLSQKVDDQERKKTKFFSYRPPQAGKDSDTTGRTGALEYRDYEKGFMLLVPIPAEKAVI